MANRILEEAINLNGLRCIFVGGKREAGKTTCSCALAVQLAKTMSSVLLVSIRSVYNISDIFEQSFSAVPTKVNRFENLFAVELDPRALPKNVLQEGVFKSSNQRDLAKLVIDSFLNYDVDVFADVMKIVEEQNIDVVVVDAASSIETDRIWPARQPVGEKSVINSRNYEDIFTKGIDLEQHSITMYNTEIYTKLGSMPKIRCLSKQPCDTIFIYVDTAHPFTIIANKALILNLDVHGIKTFLVMNKMTTVDIPRNAKGYIYKLGWNSPSDPIEYTVTDESYVNEESQVIKLPLWGTKIRGVQEITSFSEYLIKPFVKKPTDRE